MATYNVPYPPQFFPNQIPQVNISNQQQPMIWVKDQAQAESYPMAYNATVVLWDQNQDSIYIKSTDVLGKPTIKILDYKIREENTPKVEENKNENIPEYATKQDLIDFMNKVSEEIRQLKPVPNRRFKEDQNNG